MKTMAPRIVAAFLILSLSIPHPAFGLRPPAAVETNVRGGLEEALTAGLEEWDSKKVTPVRTLEGTQLQKRGARYLVQDLTSPEVERLLKNRSREYGFYGFVLKGKPHFLIEVGRDGKLNGSEYLIYLTPQKARRQVKKSEAIHNHNTGFAFPSWSDFNAALALYLSGRIQRDFVYGSRTGRIVEHGVSQRRSPEKPAHVRLRIWREGEEEPKEEWIPWNRVRKIFNSRSYFYGAIRRRGAVRVEVDDREGRWVRWDRKVTLASVLREAGLKAASGLEESSPIRILVAEDNEETRGEIVRVLREQAQASGAKLEIWPVDGFRSAKKIVAWKGRSFFDGIMADGHLGDGFGWDLIEQMINPAGEVPIPAILFSDTANDLRFKPDLQRLQTSGQLSDSIEKPRRLKEIQGPVTQIWNRLYEKISRRRAAGPSTELRTGLEETATVDLGRVDAGILAQQATATSVRVVLGPTAFHQVPGLRRVVEALSEAGLGERFLLLPEEGLPEEMLQGELDQLAIRLFSVKDLSTLAYAAQGDTVMQRFSDKLKPWGVILDPREPKVLEAVTRQILLNLGVPERLLTERAIRQFLYSAGLEEAA